MRAFQTISDYITENINGKTKINFYLDTESVANNFLFRISKGEMSGGYHIYNISFEKTEEMQQPLMLRIPSWTGDFRVTVNGREADAKTESNYFLIDTKLNSGDIVQVQMKYKTRLIRPDKSTMLIEEIKKSVDGALCYGPHIMAIDGKMDYTFLSEPINNQIYTNTIQNARGNKALEKIIGNSFAGDAYLTAHYKHGGFPSYYETVFRPVSEMTYHRHPYMLVTMRFVPESANDSANLDKTMVDPWTE